MSYIIGPKGKMVREKDPPRRVPLGRQWRASFGKASTFQWFDINNRSANILEGKTLGNKRIYVRTCPADMEPDLDSIEEQIEDAEEALAMLRDEQQELLYKAAAAGGKVRVPK